MKKNKKECFIKLLFPFSENFWRDIEGMVVAFLFVGLPFILFAKFLQWFFGP